MTEQFDGIAAAYLVVNDGRKIRQSDWPKGDYLLVKDGRLTRVYITENGKVYESLYSLDANDLQAKNWEEIVEEAPAPKAHTFEEILPALRNGKGFYTKNLERAGFAGVFLDGAKKVFVAVHRATGRSSSLDYIPTAIMLEDWFEVTQ